MNGAVVVLTGGVGGAKLVIGARDALPSGSVTAIVNTGDDFEHLGLSVSPDIDTLLYSASGQANVAQGWGREGETWSFMAAIRSLGGADWFQLGDGDLALHVLRTAALRSGRSLSAFTAEVADRWDTGLAILPMSDQQVATVLETEEGELAFQPYFVGRRAEPVVRSIRYDGSAQAVAAPGVLEALDAPGLRAILIAPSNPFLSIDPILAVPDIRDALIRASAPVVAVSPLIAGAAVKGPTAKLMRELSLEVNAATIARHYAPVIDAILLDERDQPVEPGIPYARADTLLDSSAARVRVAVAALELADSIG